jgi:hypothetical protein
MINVSDKCCRENENTHILFNTYFRGHKVAQLVDTYFRGHTEAQLVEALRYKLEGRGFDSRLCN